MVRWLRSAIVCWLLLQFYVYILLMHINIENIYRWNTFSLLQLHSFGMNATCWLRMYTEFTFNFCRALMCFDTRYLFPYYHYWETKQSTTISFILTSDANKMNGCQSLQKNRNTISFSMLVVQWWWFSTNDNIERMTNRQASSIVHTANGWMACFFKW